MASPEDLRSDYPGSVRQRLVAGLVALVMVPIVLVNANASAQGVSTPLLVVGTDVATATVRSATYETTIRNEGNGEATNVWVSMVVPQQTTFESSDPPSSAPEGSPAGAPATCDNGGTREPNLTKCEWYAGTLPPGDRRTLRVVLNLLPTTSLNTATQIDVTFRLTGTDPATGAAIPESTDRDNALNRIMSAPSATNGPDTFVNRAEPANTNHGKCPVLTTRGDGTSAAYFDLARASDPNPFAFSPSIDRLLDAELQMNVAASDYTTDAPGSVALHAITSGDWAEGSSINCGAGGIPGSGNELRTGFEPAVANIATASALVTGPGAIRWNVAQDIDGAAERAAFQGWQIRNASGSGSLDLSSTESDASLTPRVALIYTVAEAGRCIDVDPDFNVAHPTAEQRFTAVVMKSSLTGTNYQRQMAGSADACGGTPVAGQLVTWNMDDDIPDVYISNQAGTVVPKGGTATNAAPNTIQTTTGVAGSTFVGVRLANPNGPSGGENRIAGCTDLCSGTPEPETSCSELNEQLGICSRQSGGESTTEDDARFAWSPTETSPSPGPTSSPSGWPSPSGSPTPSASPSSGQSPSPSASPSATASPTAAPSASPSTSAAGNLSSARLDLSSSTQESDALSEVVLSGALSSDNPTCAQPGTTVQLFERGAESTTPQHLAYVGTGVGGTFEHKVSPEANTIYSARVGEHDLCAVAESDPVTVLVRPVVTIKSTVKEVKRGRRFWVTGTVMPEHQLSPVTLWRKIGPGKWKRIRRTYLDEGSRYSFGVKYKWKRRRSVLLVRWNSQDADHISSESPKLRIKRKLKKT